MADDNSFPDTALDKRPGSVAEARRELAMALDGAAHEHDHGEPDGDDDLVKPGDAGYKIELRLNGKTIPLAGEDANTLAKSDFQDFLDREKAAVEAGDYDAAIDAALAEPGPGKALARVRAVDSASDPIRGE